MKIYNINSRVEPFVDRFLIESMANTVLKLHRPDPAGTVISFDQPWECVGAGYVTILKDNQRYLMYYRGTGKVSEDNDPEQSTCLSISDDAINWQKPELNLYEAASCSTNNVVLQGVNTVSHNFSPFIDENPNCDPDEKFKGVGGTVEYGLFLFVSKDGIHWKLKQDKPILPPPPEGHYWYDSQNNIFYSKQEGCYVCFFRMFEKVGSVALRGIARRTSPDLLNWSDFTPMDYANTTREQLYTNQTIPYYRADHIYLAICARFMEGKQVISDEEGEQFGIYKHNDYGYWHDCSDAVFMTSRPEHTPATYDRTFMEAFVRPGQDRLNWSSRSNYPAKAIVQTAPNEISIYIERHNAHRTKHLERMTMRLDGFASINAPYAGGQATTIPIECPGGKLILNYATSAAGSIKVGLLDIAGKTIEGYTLQQSDTIVGDEIKRQVTWAANKDLNQLKGQPIKLQFDIKDADIYSMRFELD